MSNRRSYSLHGFEVGLAAEAEPWLEAVDEILRAYRVEEPSEAPGIQARLGSTPLSPPEGLLRRCAFDDLRFWSTPSQDELWIDVHGEGWVRVDPLAGHIEAGLALDPVKEGWLVAHHAFYPALLEILKAQGMFPAHAGLVSRGGDGLLICGASGSGKTTLTLVLAQRGWSLLADDTCFLRRHEQEVEGLAFWEDLHVTDDAIERLGSLDFLHQQPARHANWKKHFGVEQLPAGSLASSSRPRWLLFPTVAGHEKSRVQKISGTEALTRLVPQSVIPAREATVEAHLSVLAHTVRQVQSFVLEMSPDFDDVTSTLGTALFTE